MGLLSLDQIVFSAQVQEEWADPQMYTTLKSAGSFINPTVQQQVVV